MLPVPSSREPAVGVATILLTMCQLSITLLPYLTTRNLQPIKSFSLVERSITTRLLVSHIRSRPFDLLSKVGKAISSLIVALEFPCYIFKTMLSLRCNTRILIGVIQHIQKGYVRFTSVTNVISCQLYTTIMSALVLYRHTINISYGIF